MTYLTVILSLFYHALDPKENKSNKNSEFSDESDEFSDSKLNKEASLISNKNKPEG